LLNPDHLDALYNNNYVGEESQQLVKNYSVTERDYTKKGWKHSLFVLRSIENSTLRIVDFGCGTFSPFLSEARKLGHHVHGVEWHEKVCKIAERNMRCSIETTESFFTGTENFDIIFLGDVLEHLSPPLPTLERLLAKLKKPGFLIMQGPLEANSSILNIALLLYGRLKDKHVEHLPYHTSLATSQGISSISQQLNLKVVYFKRYSTYWPAPNLKELRSNFNFRGLVLFLIQTIDIFISKIVPSYGNRFTLMARLD
jgi:SAM-dependent methyltransferase